MIKFSFKEFGWKSNFNLTTLLIDFFEWCGLAYDLKKPTNSLIKRRQERSGDGTYNELIRVNKIFDWIIGIFITTAQLFVSLALRFCVLNIKELFA